MANNKRFIWEKVQNGIMKDGKPVITSPSEIIDKM